MPNQTMKKHIGIDVSKQTLDVYILPDKLYLQYANNEKGIGKFLSKLSVFAEAHVVLEATGGYERPLAQALANAGFATSVVNPRQIRDFAKALGRLAKTDKIDAQIIASFAQKIEPTPNVVCNENQQEIADFQARRRQLIEMLGMEKNRLDKARKEIKKLIERHIKTITKEINEIDEILDKCIQNDSAFTQKANLLTTIKGVGKQTVATLLAQLPELGYLNGKQIAALAGLAPFNRDSGKMRGQRCIWGGRASLRCGLYMATLVAVRHNSKIKAFYQRLCHAGKDKKLAIIACMRKLLVIMNAMIKNNQPWHCI